MGYPIDADVFKFKFLVARVIVRHFPSSIHLNFGVFPSSSVRFSVRSFLFLFLLLLDVSEHFLLVHFMLLISQELFVRFLEAEALQVVPPVVKHGL